MEYKDHLQKLKEIPLNKPILIKAHISGLKDMQMIDWLTARWFCSLLSEVCFVALPVAPPSWIECKAARQYKTDAWRSFWLTNEVQEYVHKKRIIECANYANYHKLKEVYSTLHPDEEQFRIKIRAKLEEFEKGIKSQAEPVFQCYDYEPKRPMYSYN